MVPIILEKQKNWHGCSGKRDITIILIFQSLKAQKAMIKGPVLNNEKNKAPEV